MIKTIKLDPKTKRYCEVDKVRLAREATTLKTYLESVKNGSMNIEPEKTLLIKLCESAINRQIAVPLDRNDLPLRYQIREGMLPDDFEDLLASFYITATGTPRENKVEKIINGEAFVEVDFE